MTDHMQDWLDSQSELQKKMPSKHPTELFNMYDPAQEEFLPPEDADRKPAIDFLHWNVTALTDELHELLAETGWKPWAKSRHINLEAARGEAIDAMHFLANIFLALGLNDAEEIMRRYHEKHAKNAKRQEEGYDGVSTKCPGCKRALDDEAVKCQVDPEHNRYFCESKGTWQYIEVPNSSPKLKPGSAANSVGMNR